MHCFATVGDDFTFCNDVRFQGSHQLVRVQNAGIFALERGNALEARLEITYPSLRQQSQSLHFILPSLPVKLFELRKLFLLRGDD